MLKPISRILSVVMILSLLFVPLQFAVSAAEPVKNELLALSKTTHESSKDTGSIVFANNNWEFKNSNDMLGTGPILKKSVTDFEWEFDYWSDNPAWTQERFMFHCALDGIYDQGDTYCLEIRGINYGNGPALYKNGNFTTALGEYKVTGNLKTKTWDEVVYHTKITVKDNVCKVWFYEKGTTQTNPVITVDLGNKDNLSGDFKIQGYASKMNLMHMVIRTGDTDYYFDKDDVPSGEQEQKPSEEKQPETKEEDDPAVKLLKLPHVDDPGVPNNGTIDFADHTWNFNCKAGVLSTGPITGKSYGDFDWEFDYWSNDPAWTQERFMFHSTDDGIGEENAYILEIRGINHGNGPALYKNGDYTKPLGQYKWPTNLESKDWIEDAIYHVKISVKGNKCSVWFYKKGAPAKDPVFTVDLAKQNGPKAGDFKIQGYSSKMHLMNMVIATDKTTYYFDESNVVNPGNPNAPKGPATGDNSALVAIIAALSAATVCAFIISFKKRTHN